MIICNIWLSNENADSTIEHWELMKIENVNKGGINGINITNNMILGWACYLEDHPFMTGSIWWFQAIWGIWKRSMASPRFWVNHGIWCWGNLAAFRPRNLFLSNFHCNSRPKWLKFKVSKTYVPWLPWSSYMGLMWYGHSSHSSHRRGIQSIPWWFDCTLEQSDIANGGYPLAMEAYRPIRLGGKSQWIALREILQETAIFNVKNHGFL